MMSEETKLRFYDMLAGICWIVFAFCILFFIFAILVRSVPAGHPILDIWRCGSFVGGSASLLLARWLGRRANGRSL